VTNDKINLKESLLIEDGEDIHVFHNGDYKGILDMSLYNQALEDVRKTIRLPTEPQLNIFLFSDEEFDELPPELEYYDENIQSIHYKGDEGLEEVFRNSPLSDSRNPPISILIVKGAAVLTGLVLSEGIKNKMKNRGMLPRAINQSQPSEIEDELAADYAKEGKRDEGDLEENPPKPPSDPPSGSIEDDFKYTKEHAPRVWEAITDEPWTFEEGMKGLEDDMLEGDDFTQNMIDSLEEIVDVGLSQASVAESAAKKIWDFLYAANLLIWSRPRHDPGSLVGPIEPGETADYWLKEGIGVEGQRTRVSKSEWQGDIPYRNIIPPGTPVALRNYTVRMLAPDGHPSASAVEDYMDGERLDPNKLEIAAVVDILDFGGFFFPSLIASQYALTDSSPSSVFVAKGGTATSELNSDFERPQSWYGYVYKSKDEIHHYHHYMKRSERNKDNREFEQSYPDDYWVRYVTNEFSETTSSLVNKPPLKLEERYASGDTGYRGFTNTEYCVIRIDFDEMEDLFGFAVFDNDDFEGKFAFVLPRSIVHLDDSAMYPYMDIETTQSLKDFMFTGVYPWDKSVEAYDEDVEGWTDEYADGTHSRDFITWFYLKYGMVATHRDSDAGIGNPAVPHAMIEVSFDVDDVEGYAETMMRVALERSGREVYIRGADQPWTDDDSDIYGLYFDMLDAQNSMHFDNRELFFKPENDERGWDDYPGPEVGHYEARHNRSRMVNLLNEISSMTAPTPAGVDVDTQTDKHPEPPTAEPEEEEEVEEEEEPEEAPSDVTEDIDAEIEGLAPGEEEVEAVPVGEAPQPNLTYMETSDNGGIASGLYPFPFVDVEDIHASLVSDVWVFSSWDEEDISDNKPDTGYLDSMFNNEGVEYLFLVNLGTEDISYQRHDREYDDIDDDEWISKFKDFLDFDEDRYILLAYTSKSPKEGMYSLGGTYFPPSSPTHVLVEDDARSNEDIFAWKLVPIQDADSLYLFNRDDPPERKLYKDVKAVHTEGSATFDESITREKFEGIAAVGEGSEEYVKLFGGTAFMSKWKNWKEALMEKLDIPSDMSNRPCIMVRVAPERDEWYESPDMPEDDLMDKFFEELRRNPPIDTSDDYSMEVEKEPDLLEKIEKVTELPRDEIPYNPKEDKIPRIPKDTLTDRPVFHHPEVPVKVKGEGGGDEPGGSERVEESGEAERERHIGMGGESVGTFEGLQYGPPLSNPDDKSKILSRIKRDVDAIERKGEEVSDRVEVFQRPFEPSLEPDAHFEKVASIDGVLNNIFAFPDEITRAMVMCSALNEDWVTLLKGIPGCVTGDCNYITGDGRIVPFDEYSHLEPDIYDMEEEVLPGPSDVRKLHIYDVDDTYVIKTKMGRRYRLTPNHPLMTDEGWRDAEDMEVGDKLELFWDIPEPSDDVETGFDEINFDDTGKSKDIDVPEVWNENLGFIFGAFVAEGSLSKNRVEFVLGGDELEFSNKIEQLVKEEFSVEPTIRSQNGKDVRILRYYSKNLQKVFSEVVDCDKFRVPTDILSSDNDVASSFLRGLFEGDGSVGSSHHRQREINGNEYEREQLNRRVRLKAGGGRRNLLQEVQTLLMRFGISSRVRSDDYYDGRYDKDYTHNQLMIGAEINLKNYRDEIGFVSDFKSGRLDKICDYKRAGKRELPEYDEVVSVERIEDESVKVYDVEVPETETFIANGIVSHNTGKTVLAHLMMMSFMNDIDFQTDEVNVNKLYTDDVVSNYLQKVDVWGVTKHNQDKQPDDVFYETEIRMTESRAPEEALMADVDRYEAVVDYIAEIEDIPNWKDKLKDEGYDDDDIENIDVIRDKLDEWEDLPEGELDYIRDSYEWLETRFQESVDDATPIGELVVKGEGGGVVEDLRENIPKDIERQLERVRGRTTLQGVRDYVFDPKRKPIVESLVKYHNEANRANPNVADTMLGLIAEKQVEYLGKPLSSPVYGQKFPCLHYLDYNPHLDMREDQELDRALLDRANMGIYLRQADFRGREKILEGKYGIDWDAGGDASSKSVEEQLIDAAVRGIDADDGFEPLSYLELQEVWNVVDQIPLTDQQIMLINIITQHFSMLYKKYDTKAYDVLDVNEDLVSEDFIKELDKKRERFFSKRDADLIDEENDEWRADFVDTSTIAYIDAKQQAGEDVGGGTGATAFNKAGLINQVDRELGLRSAESLVGLMKAYAYYKAARESVSDDSFEINDMTDFQDVIKDEWIPLLLSYVIEHRINIGVLDTLQTRYFNFGDFVDGWYLPQVLVGKGDEEGPPLWVKWKIWTQCAHPDVSGNQSELMDNVLEVVEQMKDDIDSNRPLHSKLDAYSTKEALFRDIDGGENTTAEPTIQAIFNSVARNR